MKFYLYRPDASSFTGIGFSSDDDQRIVDVHYTDKPLVNQWTPPIAREFEPNPETGGDFPSLSNFWRIPAMSEQAWNALRSLIGYCCEALPIVHPTGRPYFIVHVMDTLDCLDCSKSELSRNATSGRVNRIYRYSFKNETLRGKHIFKLPVECGAELIVDDDFRRAIEFNSLRGLLFNALPMAD